MKRFLGGRSFYFWCNSTQGLRISRRNSIKQNWAAYPSDRFAHAALLFQNSLSLRDSTATLCSGTPSSSLRVLEYSRVLTHALEQALEHLSRPYKASTVRASNNEPGGFEMKRNLLYRIILDCYRTTSFKVILTAEYGSESQKVADGVSVQARRNWNQAQRQTARKKGCLQEQPTKEKQKSYPSFFIQIPILFKNHHSNSSRTTPTTTFFWTIV